MTYRALKRRFALDEEYPADLKRELIKPEGTAAFVSAKCGQQLG